MRTTKTRETFSVIQSLDEQVKLLNERIAQIDWRLSENVLLSDERFNLNDERFKLYVQLNEKLYGLQVEKIDRSEAERKEALEKDRRKETKHEFALQKRWLITNFFAILLGVLAILASINGYRILPL